jgi:hypothetical protein
MLMMLALRLLADFSIDPSSLLTTASQIFNALWPAFAIVIGISLGLGLLALIVSEIRKAL